MSENIEHITIAVPQEQLDDLHARLARVRWPDGRTVSDTSQGPTQEKIAALVDYWREAYDWRRVEAELNDVGDVPHHDREPRHRLPPHPLE